MELSAKAIIYGMFGQDRTLQPSFQSSSVNAYDRANSFKRCRVLGRLLR